MNSSNNELKKVMETLYKKNSDTFENFKKLQYEINSSYKTTLK